MGIGRRPDTRGHRTALPRVSVCGSLRGLNMPRGHPNSLLTRDQRFWMKVLISDGCWEWETRRYRKSGEPNSGTFWWDEDLRIVSSPRAAWMLWFGKIPDGLHVLHTCDNPPCVRPSHLFLGTHQDNMDDKALKGRRNCLFGERVPSSKFTNDIVILIRQSSERTCVLARQLKMSWSAVDAARRGVTWKHLPLRPEGIELGTALSASTPPTIRPSLPADERDLPPP